MEGRTKEEGTQEDRIVERDDERRMNKGKEEGAQRRRKEELEREKETEGMNK